MQNNQSSEWRSIFKLAAFAAFASIAIIPIQMVFFIIWPLPTDILSWFVRYHNNWLIGLIGLDILLIIQNSLVIFMYLGFSVVLWSQNKALILLAIAFGFLGLCLYFSSNTSIEMLNLSQQFYATDNPIIQNQLLSAGQMALATFNGTGYDTYYIFSAIALLLFSYTMTNGDAFSKLTAYFGLASGILMLVPANVGIVGLTMSIMSLIPWIGFCYLAGRQFMVLSHK